MEEVGGVALSLFSTPTISKEIVLSRMRWSSPEYLASDVHKIILWTHHWHNISYACAKQLYKKATHCKTNRCLLKRLFLFVLQLSVLLLRMFLVHVCPSHHLQRTGKNYICQLLLMRKGSLTESSASSSSMCGEESETLSRRYSSQCLCRSTKKKVFFILSYNQCNYKRLPITISNLQK